MSQTGMKVRAAIARNGVAGVLGKASVVAVRLFQVPLLIRALGVSDYGRWLVLASIPSWLAVANIGFGNAAATEMSLGVASNDLRRARTSYSSTVVLVITIQAIGAGLSLLLAPLVPWEHFLSLPDSRHYEISTAVRWSAFTVLLSFLGDVFYGRFRANRKTHFAMTLFGIRPWLDLATLVTALHFNQRLDTLALSGLVSAVLFLLAAERLSRIATPQIVFRVRDVQPSKFRSILQKGAAFQSFTLGNALLFQGNLVIVEATLGSAAVALFGTTRTLVRSINQVLELVNQIVLPELNHLFGAGNLGKARQLHRVSVAFSVAIALSLVILLAFVGPSAYDWWTHHAILLPEHLLLIFLLPIPFNSLWYTSSVVHYACNQPEGLAIRYLIACILSAGACYILSRMGGVGGAALSTLVGDLMLIPYVFRRSMVLTEDTWPALMAAAIEKTKSISLKITRGILNPSQ